MFVPDVSHHGNSEALERYIAWADRHDSNSLWIQAFYTGYLDSLDPESQVQWMLRLSPGFHGDFQKFLN